MNAKKRKELGYHLVISPDEDKKTDKAVRIEANLEPLNRNGMLILNEDEKDNPHMQELESQFKLFDMHLPYPADGPDCIEGAYSILRKKQNTLAPVDTVPVTYITQKNRHRR